MSRETDDLELMGKTRPEADEDLEDFALGEDYALNPEYVPMVADALDRGDARLHRRDRGRVGDLPVGDRPLDGRGTAGDQGMIQNDDFHGAEVGQCLCAGKRRSRVSDTLPVAL